MHPTCTHRIIVIPVLVALLTTTNCEVEAQETIPATGQISGRQLDINGTTKVPSGLFGVHNVPMTPERMASWNIDANRFITHGPKGTPVLLGKHKRAPAGIEILLECFYDRFQPALTLTKQTGWEDFLIQLGKTYGSKAAGSGQTHYIEFWNEPYLNWATKPGVNYDPRHYVTKDIKAGDPVLLRDTKAATGLVWKQGRWYKALNRVGDIGGTYSAIGVGPLYRQLMAAEAGDELEWGGRKIRAIDTLVPYDPEQPSWWSGPSNRSHYINMYNALGKGLSETNTGNVKLLAGWGFHIHQDWPKAWEIIHKPTIDATIAYLDGYHEHHYGGDTREVAADYEMVSAYILHTHGKRIQFFNTECGANYDSQRPDKWKTADEKWFEATYADIGDRKRRIAFGYMLRDVIHLIDICPDKAVFRVSHHAHTNGGTPSAFEILNQLRGTLVECSSDDPEVWIVASQPDPDSLVIAAYNDARTPRALSLSAPAQVASWSRRQPEFTPTGLTLQQTTGTGSALSAVLEPHTGASWHCRLDRALPAVPTQVEQFVADRITMRITDQAASCTVTIPADKLQEATAARLKIVQTGWPSDQPCQIGIGDQQVSVGMRPFTTRQEIPLTALEGETTLHFPVGTKAYEIRMASIELIKRP